MYGSVQIYTQNFNRHLLSGLIDQHLFRERQRRAVASLVFNPLTGLPYGEPEPNQANR